MKRLYVLLSISSLCFVSDNSQVESAVGGGPVASVAEAVNAANEFDPRAEGVPGVVQWLIQ